MADTGDAPVAEYTGKSLVRVVDALVVRCAYERPDVLLQAAEPLFAAIDAGTVVLTRLDGFDRHPISLDVFHERHPRSGATSAAQSPAI